MKLQISIEDQLTPRLRDFNVAITDGAPMMQKLGEDLAKALRDHFRRRNQQPNAKGWPKRNFWNKEGRENTALTNYNATSATVTIASAAIAHKVKGGTVRPKRARALAIPAIAAAYKAIQPSAMDKNFLEFIPIPKSGGLVGMLVERQHDTLRSTKRGFKQGEKRGGQVWFWIVSQATHRKDTNTLPPEREVEAQIQASAQAYLARIAGKR